MNVSYKERQTLDSFPLRTDACIFLYRGLSKRLELDDRRQRVGMKNIEMVLYCI